MKTAYSYKRWSSKKQTEGDSLARQTEKAAAVCIDKGWKLVDLPPDKGISAWKGKNRNVGSLGIFLNKAEAGRIETPCVLIVEKLDRFSRQEVDEIIVPFINLIKSGVEVYSVIENEHYTKEALKKDPMLTIMKMVMAFYGANQYSVALSDRICAQKRRKFAAQAKGQQVELTEYTPYYFDFNGVKYVENKHSPAVQRIFKEYATGTKSHQRIADDLTADGVPTFTNGSRNKGKVWDQATVRWILKSRFPLGEYKGVQGYFPALVSKEVWNKADQNLQSRKWNGRKSEFTNFLRSLLVCSSCGQSVCYQCNGKMKTGGNYTYYRCSNRKCTQKLGYKQPQFEAELFAVVARVKSHNPETLIGSENSKLDTEIKAIQAHLTDISRKISKAMEYDIETGSPESKALVFKYTEQRTGIEVLLKKKLSEMTVTHNAPGTLKEIQSLFNLPDAELGQLDNFFRDMIDQLKDEQIRLKLSNLMPNLIKQIRIDSKASRFDVEWTSGETTKLEDILV